MLVSEGDRLGIFAAARIEFEGFCKLGFRSGEVITIEKTGSGEVGIFGQLGLMLARSRRDYTRSFRSGGGLRGRRRRRRLLRGCKDGGRHREQGHASSDPGGSRIRGNSHVLLVRRSR